jgi:hypothetical protein
MTTPDGSAPSPALAAVRRLESALDQGNDARDAAGAALDAAHAEAEGLLADARAAGTAEGRRRRAALLADSKADAAAIRVTGEVAAEALLRRVSAERDALVAEFTAAVLVKEA